MGASPFTAHSDGVAVRVHLTPGAARPGLGAIESGPDGKPVLKVRVAARPEAGRANAALCRMLAKAWGVPPTTPAVTRGTTSRLKTVRVGGDGAALLARLEAWSAAQDAARKAGAREGADA